MGFKADRKLPVPLQSIIKESGTRGEKIQYVVPTDMNMGGEFADGYIIVTDKRLIASLLAPDRQRIHSYKGYDQQPQETGQWACRCLPLSEIKEIRLEDCVGCNMLVVKTTDNEERSWAFASNFHKHKLFRLTNSLEEYLRSGVLRPPEKEKELFQPHNGGHKSIFFRVMGYFRPYRMRMALTMVCILAAAGLNLVWPYLNGAILYDHVLAGDNYFLKQLHIPEGRFTAALVMVVLTMFLSKLTLLAVQVISGICSSQTAINVTRDMKKDIFRKMENLSISFYHSRQTGNLMTRVMSDADRISGFFVDDAPNILVHGATILSTVAVMMVLNWPMALLTAAMLPVLAAVTVLLRPRIWVMYGKRHRAERSLNNCVHDNLTGARVVKAFGQEEREAVRFGGYSDQLKRTEVSLSYWQNFFQLFFSGAQELATLGVWLLGVLMILRASADMDLGILITFAGYVSQMKGPMNYFSNLSQRWADSMNSAQRMFEIMDALPDVLEPDTPVILSEPEGNLILQHVTFGYEVNRIVLKDINMHIPAGSVIGIVGRSGVGKSTLVNLISRMYDPQEGSILLDGVDIKQLSFKDLRRNVALVSQETYIFRGTIAENIAYSHPDAPLPEIIRAAKLAGAHEFIMRMQDGYETLVGASGTGLSGGERQRISIARAILANPRILILDEATAAVDTETERLIQKSLDELAQGRTTISIAHRLSTLRNADYLYVIENGRIAEEGTREELTARHGIYYKLVRLQTGTL